MERKPRESGREKFIVSLRRMAWIQEYSGSCQQPKEFRPSFCDWEWRAVIGWRYAKITCRNSSTEKPFPSLRCSYGILTRMVPSRRLHTISPPLPRDLLALSGGCKYFASLATPRPTTSKPLFPRARERDHDSHDTWSTNRKTKTTRQPVTAFSGYNSINTIYHFILTI